MNKSETMMTKNETMLRDLCKQLGDNYTIRTIDLERCLYRDFGNGFNVEISSVNTARASKPVTLYLWFGEGPAGCLIVKSVHDVARKDIADTVDDLYGYSEQLLREGFNTLEALWGMLNPKLFADGGVTDKTAVDKKATDKTVADKTAMDKAAVDSSTAGDPATNKTATGGSQ